MAIDIKNITHALMANPVSATQLLKDVEQKTNEQLVALSRTINSAIGKAIIATVKSTEAIAPEEREKLIKQTADALATLNKNNGATLSPLMKDAINRLLDQQQLLKSPDLKWATLAVNNRELLTYTDKPLSTGQSIPVQIQNGQKLLLLELPQNTQNQSVKNTDMAHAQTIIAKELRALLPQQDKTNLLFQSIHQWQALPADAKQTLLPKNVADALKQLAAKIRTPQELSNPKTLQNLVKNAGQSLETQLAQALGLIDESAQEQQLQRIFSQDNKGALLNLLAKITLALANQNQTGKPFFPPDETQTLSALLQHLLANPKKDLTTKDIRTHILLLLQEHSSQSLAKIQLQQLHNLNDTLDSRDATQAKATWQIDIPVKHHDQLHTVQLHIERDWADEHHRQDETPGYTRAKQWSVNLRFDLPTLGDFCAQLRVIDNDVNLTLWAIRDNTIEQIKHHMDGLRAQLEQEGINVKNLQCIKGMPPQKTMALSYSLIDVST